MVEPKHAARLALFEHYREQQEVEWIEATGTSMLPTIVEGDWLLVDFGEPHPGLGDIVMFPGGGRLVVHRVVRRRNGMLVTKGDNSQCFDPPVRPADVLGVVRVVRRGESGPASAEGCAGRRAVALALLSSGSAHGLGLAAHIPPRIRHPLSRPVRRVLYATLQTVARPKGVGSD